MKILFINNLGTIHSGAEIIIAQLRRELIERGHEVRILAGNEPGNGEQIADYLFRTFRDGSMLKFLYVFNPFAIIALWRILRTYRPDIIHLHNISKASPFILALLKHYPTILTIHDHMVFDPTRISDVPLLAPYKNTLENYFIEKPSVRFYLERLRFFFFRRFAKYINIAFACSDFYCQCAKDSEIFQNVKTLHNGINLPEQSPIENWNNLLFVGRLEKNKGARLVVEATAKILIEHPSIKVNIAGTGTQMNDLKRKAKELGISNIVRFEGYQSFKQIEELYRKTTIIVVPSLYPDNLPTVCIEAMAIGRPVVGSMLGGIPELIANGKTGLLFSPGNNEELVKCVNQLLNDRQLMRSMGDAGRIKAEQEFSASIYLKKILEAYKQLISKTDYEDFNY